MATLRHHALTRHASVRMQQRGLRQEDIRLFLDEASQVTPEAYLLKDEDVARAVRRKQTEIRRLERLRGTQAIVLNGVIVTCYHATPTDQTRLMRRGRSKALDAGQ